MIKIPISEEVRRFNAQVELADIALGNGAADAVSDPRKLLSLLSLAGHFELRATLQEAGARLGYWAPDGGPAPTPSADPGQSPPVISDNRTRSEDPDVRMSIRQDGLLSIAVGRGSSQNSMIVDKDEAEELHSQLEVFIYLMEQPA